MPTSFKSDRPKLFAYSSMAELYQQYCWLFLQGESFRREIRSSCGLRIALMDRHFLHLADVTRDGVPKGELNIQEEKPILLATRAGFGPYKFDEYRARQLPAALACISNPDAAFRIPSPKTATHVLFKHYGDGRYPVTEVMLTPDDKDRSTLMPITQFQAKVKQARARYEEYDLVWKRLA